MVVPSNVDIATTEALSMAQEVDPDGDRTIGEESGDNSCVGASGDTSLNPDGPNSVHSQDPTKVGGSEPFILSPW